MKIVNNLRRLKELEKEGLIKLHPQTGCKVKSLDGQLVTTWYIDDYVKSSEFVFKGRKYSVKYVDGCFFPFVFETN